MSRALYRDLETHSALFILRHATQLAKLDCDAVIDMLDSSPVVDSGTYCLHATKKSLEIIMYLWKLY